MHFASTSNDKKQLSLIKMKENERNGMKRKREKSIVVLFERNTLIKSNKCALHACLQSNSSN